MENEVRLIDANALVWSIGVGDNGKQFFYVKAENIDNAPTVDAVEVVRCKDCGYWKYMEEYYGECSHPRFRLDGHPDPTMEINGFCSCGERREGE